MDTATLVFLGASIVSSLVLELGIYHFRRKLRVIKSLPVQSTRDFLNESKENKPHRDLILLNGNVNDENSCHISINSRNLTHFKFNDNDILINSYYTIFLNPRKLNVEKIPLPFNALLSFACYLLNVEFEKRLYYMKRRQYQYTDQFSDLFSFLLGGDQITLLVENNNHSLNIIHDNILVRPNVVMQGNKLCMVNYYKTFLRKSEFLRYFLTFPLIISSGISLAIRIASMVMGKRVRERQVPAKSRGGSFKENCSKCKSNYAQVIIKNCNHFNLCVKCFEEQGRMCALCQEKFISFIILDNSKAN